MRRILFCLGLPFHLFAIWVGNPAQPFLQAEGVIQVRSTWYCLRAGYMSDHLYRQSFTDEFQIDGIVNPPTASKQITDAGTLALNIKDCFDFTAFLGSSQVQVDRDIFAKRQFAWSIGSKFIIYKRGCFTIGADLKYFESEQKPLYFVAEGRPYNVLSDYKLTVSDTQAALGCAYTAGPLTPYVMATYIYSKIEPRPLTVLVQIPFFDYAVDIVSKSVISRQKWGMALGATLISACKGSLAVEARLINQFAINVSGEIRF